MRYIALHENEVLVSIEIISANAQLFSNKLSIIEDNKEVLNNMLLAKGFTQSEIDEKMPVEEPDDGT